MVGRTVRGLGLVMAILALVALGAAPAQAGNFPEEKIVSFGYTEAGYADDFGDRSDGYSLGFQYWYDTGVSVRAEVSYLEEGPLGPESYQGALGLAKKVGDGAFYFPADLAVLKLDGAPTGDEYAYGVGTGVGIDFKAGNHLGFQVEGLYHYFFEKGALKQNDLGTVNARFCIRF